MQLRENAKHFIITDVQDVLYVSIGRWVICNSSHSQYEMQILLGVARRLPVSYSYSEAIVFS
jgi:hypothetical protein